LTTASILPAAAMTAAAATTAKARDRIFHAQRRSPWKKSEIARLACTATA